MITRKDIMNLESKLVFPFLLVTTFLFTSCNGQPQENKNLFVNLNSPEFGEKIKSQPGIILDVRTEDEYREGHLPDAMLMDYYDEDFKARILKLDSTQTIYVYCQAGIRSAKAGNILGKAGFKNVFCLKGGIDQWEENKLPLEK